MTSNKAWAAAMAVMALVASGRLSADTPVDPGDYSGWVEWILDGELSRESPDNVNHSAGEPDEHSDDINQLAVTGGRYYQLSGTTRFSAALEARRQDFERFDDLSNTQLSLLLSARHKFGLGGERPWLQGFLSYADINADNDLRDGERLETGVRLGMRYDERLDGSISLAYVETESDEQAPIHARFRLATDVFDLEGTRALLAGNYLLSDNWLLGASYEFYHGDVWANCPGVNVPTLVTAERVSGIIRDPVFGGCTYRTTADVTTWRLGLSYAFNGHASLTASFLDWHGEARTVDYDGTQFRLALMYSL